MLLLAGGNACSNFLVGFVVGIFLSIFSFHFDSTLGAINWNTQSSGPKKEDDTENKGFYGNEYISQSVPLSLAQK